jgi:hypothetical protein
VGATDGDGRGDSGAGGGGALTFSVAALVVFEPKASVKTASNLVPLCAVVVGGVV